MQCDWHIPSGFECGYGGSGPAQLALAVLAEVLGDELAQEHYQRFKFRVIGRLPQEGFTLSEEEVKSAATDLETD